MYNSLGSVDLQVDFPFRELVNEYMNKNKLWGTP
jgi:hypothetical protein